MQAIVILMILCINTMSKAAPQLQLQQENNSKIAARQAVGKIVS